MKSSGEIRLPADFQGLRICDIFLYIIDTKIYAILYHMKHAITPYAGKLRQLREAKRLSQRELGRLTGLPQAQISRIERGLVDPKLSTLLTLARALDFDVMFISRTLVPAIKALESGEDATLPAYRLEEEDEHG